MSSSLRGYWFSPLLSPSRTLVELSPTSPSEIQAFCWHQILTKSRVKWSWLGNRQRRTGRRDGQGNISRWSQHTCMRQVHAGVYVYALERRFSIVNQQVRLAGTPRYRSGSHVCRMQGWRPIFASTPLVSHPWVGLRECLVWELRELREA
jgi:hypothetical protein